MGNFATPTAPPLAALERMTKHYPGVVALNQVDFDLLPGEVHALVGENGAGKSTLIRLLSGVLQPDEGRILLAGREVRFPNATAARQHGVVSVHQEAEIFAPLSVAENMALAAGLPTTYSGRVRWREVYSAARAAIGVLPERIDVRQPAGRLSVAHRFMVQLAAAFHTLPRVLILDEPTSALTSVEVTWLFDQIARFKSSGVGIIYISHRQDEIFALADRITVLRDGRRVWTGLTDETDRERLIGAMVGRDHSTAAERTQRLPSAKEAAARPEVSAALPRLRVAEMTDAAGRFTGISLEVRAGEILGIYGLIGAGRSEWAQALFGVRGHCEGTIELNGRQVEIAHPGAAVRAGLVYLPEDRLRQGLCRGLSVTANVVISTLRKFCRGPLVSRAAERSAAIEQVARLGIRTRSVEQPVGELSGGNQQKVVLGRWLLSQPEVLVLDEPTRGVDVAAKAEIHRLVRQLADDGCAVILISSELPEVLAHSDRLIVFRGGAVAESFDTATATAESVARAALPSEAPDFDELARRRGHPLPKVRIPASELGLAAAVLALLCALAISTGGGILSRESLLGVLHDASTWAVLALGAATVIMAGGIDISTGSLLALSAGVAGLLMQRSTAPALDVPIAVAAACLVGTAGGLINAGVSIFGRIHPIVVTLGAMTVYRGLLVALTGGDIITEMPESFPALANGRICGIPGSALVLIAFAAAFHYWLAHTRRGRELYAVGANDRAARLVGISRRLVTFLSFGAGGLCAAVAGLLELAKSRSMQSVLGTGYELQAIAAAVIGGTAVTGGRGSVVGVCLGALLLTLLRKALVHWRVAGPNYQLVIGSLLLAAIVLSWAVEKVRR